MEKFNVSKLDRIVLLFFALFLFLIPWDLYLSNIFLIAGGALFAAERIIFKQKYEKPGRKEWGRLFSSVFVIYLFVLVSLLYTYDFSETMKFVEYRASMALVPLIFFFGFRPGRRGLEIMAAGFVAGVMLRLLYYGATAIYGIFTGALEWNALTYSSIISINSSLNDHRTYLAAHALLSSIITAYGKRPYCPPWLKATVWFVSLVSILSLESRSILGITAIVAAVFPFVARKGVRIRTAAVTWGVAVAAVAVTTFTGGFGVLYQRTSSLTVAEFQVEPAAPISGFESRASRWAASFDVIKERPLTGYGSGTEKTVMSEIYAEKGMEISLANKWDLHNQYLSFLVENGVPALLFYLWLLFTVMRRGVGEKYPAACFFVVICAWMSLFEDILNTYRMIGLFTFVTSVFVFAVKDDVSDDKSLISK